MAIRRGARSNLDLPNKYLKTIKSWPVNRLTWSRCLSLLTDPKEFSTTAKLFLILEIAINILVIECVSYTEIDWTAYMQEVEGFMNGTLDYAELKGDTGPLVYPAGFVYIFSLLYYVTGGGAHIKIAQYIFAVFYVTLLALIFRIYGKAKKVPPYVLILMCCTSYRIHSIFLLRLFNDPVAMIFLYGSINAFLDDRWYLGSLLYSLAVSVKMNILLFAPALLVAYLCNFGPFKAMLHLSICAIVQLVLALPFLLANPAAYLAGAFNFRRVFEHRWTVNWRFLTSEQFVHPYFHISLLILHVSWLCYCAPRCIVYMKSYAKLKRIGKELTPQLREREKVDMSTTSQLFLLPLFVANFIGIMFSRSLHYQFYVWYYHTLPYLVWCTRYTTAIKLTLLGLIELCWNTYPSTTFSSITLHLCHTALLYGVLKNPSPSSRRE